MRIAIKASDLIKLGLWDEFCDLRGINIWAVNEGLMGSDEELTLSEDEAKELGLIKQGIQCYPDCEFCPNPCNEEE